MRSRLFIGGLILLTGILSALAARKVLRRVFIRQSTPLRSVQAASPIPLPADLPIVFRLTGTRDELKSLASGASITPALAPPNLVGKVVVRGSGWIRLVEPAGLQFGPGGQQAHDTAFLQFTGPGTGALFDVSSPGAISFTLRSSMSFSERLNADPKLGHPFRTVIEASDEGVRQFFFNVAPHDGFLALVFSVGTSQTTYYFVPKGKEDQLFGAGVAMNVRVTWDGSGVTQLFLNGNMVHSHPYSHSKAVWSAKASFSIGARDLHEYGGGFFACGDAISNIAVASMGPQKDTKPPEVTIVSPATGETVTGSTILEAAATDNDAVNSVRFLVDGTPAGEVNSYPYRLFWDSRATAPGPHNLTVEAVDPSGNRGRQSLSFTTARSQSPDATSPAAVARLETMRVQPAEIQIGWMPATDNVGVTAYRVHRNQAVAASIPAPANQKAQRVVYTDGDVRPGQTYVYQVEALDAAGNVSALGAPLGLTAPSVAGATLRVGPGAKYAKPCDAIKAAKPGDTVEIDAAGNGSYDGDVCAWKTDDLTVRGVNGRPRIDAQGRNASGKGVWVIGGRRNIIDNVEISGSVNGDGNGAAVRLEAPDAVFRHVYFHHDQDGILTNNIGGSLLIEFSEFAYNGDGSGLSHNLYINGVEHLTFRFNYSHHAKVGHLLKTRAFRNDILYNRLTDENGTSSYEMDFPNGGLLYVVGNIIQQSKQTDNDVFISCGIEGLRPAVAQELYLVNNTFVNEHQKGHFFHIAPMPTTVKNNLLIGAATTFRLPPNARVANNVEIAEDPGFVNMAGRDYHLRETSRARAAGADPGSSAGGSRLSPEFVYVHPTGGAALPSPGRWAVGAYQ